MASTPDLRIYVVATLVIRPGQLARFEDYERKALSIAADHGGRLERSVRGEVTPGAEATEVHLLAFPSADAFANFRADPRLQALAAAREAAISRTDVLVGVEGPAYVA